MIYPLTLEQLLLREHSRANTDLLVDIILGKPELFDELWVLVLRNEDPLSRRAAWVADYSAAIHPDFIEEKIEDLAVKVITFSSDGLKRHALRMLSRSKFPKKNLGYLVDACFKWLENKSESVAVKMYSMEILGQVCKQMPELSGELYDLIKIQMTEATPGFRSCGSRIMRNISAGLR